MFRLAGVPGLGPVALARATKHFASAQALLQGDAQGWARAELPERLYGAIRAARSVDVGRRLDEVRASGGWALGLFDEAYPEWLRNIHDPPPVLYGRGRVEALRQPGAAVVGARQAGAYGTEHARRLGRDLAAAGVTVVSGLAVGVDVAAHLGALDALGQTVAVLGSGFRRVYPRQHAPLVERIVERGAVVGELPPGAAADKVNFPRRNRIISGLCRAVVVVEAREDSGSLITAREAAEQGRDVFVVPGPAGGANRGGHKLLAEGAGWCEDARDVLASFAAAAAASPRAAEAERPVPDAWRPVYAAVAREPVHVDRVIAAAGLRSSEVLGILLQLELQGWVRQLPNKHFVRS